MPNNVEEGRFITFEGPEGGGKSTQVQALAEALRAEGRTALVTREPGGTPLAEKIRALVREERTDPPVARSEVLLFLAARAQVVAEVIRPALARGEWVLCDRFADSTFAYQGYGRGIAVDLLRHFNDFATEGLVPDLTVLLDVPLEVSRARLAAREAATATAADRIEQAGAEFPAPRRGLAPGPRRRPEDFRMTVDAAYTQIEKAVGAGRPANGYLIVGGVRGMAAELAERVLRLLFGAGDLRAHPDIHRLAPEKKSRIISVEAMRTRLIDPMGETAFQGGWKAGVVYGADRLKTESANAFLKTLEEPPPQTLFLLLTEQPEQLLPTIISRCQRIDLPDARARALEEPYRGQVLDILASDSLKGATAKAAAAGRLNAVLEHLKAHATELVDAETEGVDEGPGEETGKEAYAALVAARYKDFRRDFTATLMGWFRDLMALVAAPPSHVGGDEGDDAAPLVNEARRGVLETRAAQLSLASACYNVEAVEAFAVSVDARNMNELSALLFLMDRLRFGVERAK